MILKGSHMQAVELLHQNRLKRYVIQRMLHLCSSLQCLKDLWKMSWRGTVVFLNTKEEFKDR